MLPATLGYIFSTITGQVSITYKGAADDARIELTGAVSYVVDLAMMPAAGLKGLLVAVDKIDAAGAPVTTPITLTWTSNAVAKSEELSPGGWFALASPAPVHGITALSITSTANAVVRVAALG